MKESMPSKVQPVPRRPETGDVRSGKLAADAARGVAADAIHCRDFPLRMYQISVGSNDIAIAIILDIVYISGMAITSYGFGNPLLGRQSSPEIIVAFAAASDHRRSLTPRRISPTGESGEAFLPSAVSPCARRPCGSSRVRVGWCCSPITVRAVTTLSAEEVREIYEVSRVARSDCACGWRRRITTAQSLERPSRRS